MLLPSCATAAVTVKTTTKENRILRPIDTRYTNEDYILVSSEATYAQLSVIHQEIRRYWQAKCVRELDLALWLADVTLGAARAALAGRDDPKRNPHIREIGRILASASIPAGERTAGWFDYADTALHMCERMLGARLAPAANRTLALEIDPARKRGRPCGAYATPRGIAQDVIRDVLRGLRRSTTLDVLDLSTEAGQFLITTMAAARERPEIRLFGIDRDQSALRLARKLYTFSREQAESRIPLALTCRDSLFDSMPQGWPRHFDAIVGNPPWAARRGTYTEKVRLAYSPLLAQNFDLYLAFMIRADQLLRSGGILSMVVPSTFLFNDSGRRVRGYLLEHYDVLSLRTYPRGSIVEVSCIVPVSFVLRKRAERSRAHTSTRIICEPSKVDGGARRSTGIACDAASYWKSIAGVPFHPSVRPDLQRVLRHLDGFPRLRDFGRVMPGGRLSTGNARAAEGPFIGYQARDLRPFHACERGSTAYTDECRFDRAPKVRDIGLRKVLFQDFRSTAQPRRLIAATGEPGTYAVSTAAMFVPSEPELADFWTAILNSSIANVWYKQRDISRAVKLELVRDLPVPVCDECVPTVISMSRYCADLRRQLHHLERRCIVSEEHLVLAPTHPELFWKMSEAQQMVDEILFDLYRVSKTQRSPIRAFSAARVL